MPIRFACPKCKKQLTVDSKLAGKTGKCSCGAAIKIPTPKPKTVAATPATQAAPTNPAAAASSPAASSSAANQDALAGGLGSMFDDLTEDDFNRESPYQNVYSPPKAGNSEGKLLRQLAKEDDDDEPGKVQAGKLNGTLIFMGIMNSLAAIFFFVVGGLILLGASALAAIENALPLSVGIAVVGMILLGFGLFELLSAIGIFAKQKWGYFITTMSQAFGVVFFIGVLVLTLKDGFDMVRFFIAFFLMFGAISSCAFMYKDDTKTIFRIGQSKMPMIAGILGAVIGVSLWGGMFAMGAFSEPSYDFVEEDFGGELDGEYEGGE